MFGKKQNHKPKEQIIYETEQKKLAEVRKRFIDEKFMPLMEGLPKKIWERSLVKTVK